jgi:hypothetical protein
MNTFKKFTCSECGGTVDMSRGVGRIRNYSRGYKVPIPDDFLLPTCNRCGDIYVLPEIQGELNAILEKRFLEMQAAHYRDLITILVRKHGVRHQDIVRACGITPAYLSHVLNGKRVASTTLTRLLEAFVACDSEFLRHLRGQHWSAHVSRMHAGTTADVATRHWDDDDVLKFDSCWEPSNQNHIAFVAPGSCVA